MGYIVSQHLAGVEKNRKEFYLDNGEQDLPPIRNHRDIARGSKAIDIGTGETWVLNSKWEWMLSVMSGGETANVPEFTDPSATFQFYGMTSVSKLINLSESTTITLSATFDRGTITPSYGTNGYRSGAPSLYSFTVGDATYLTETSLLTTAKSISVTPGSTDPIAASCKIDYEEGEQPLNSNGSSYGDPYPAGSFELDGLSLVPVYPVKVGLSLASLSNAELGSNDSMYIRYVSLAAEATDDALQTFAIPADLTLTGVKMQDIYGDWVWITGTQAGSLSTFKSETITYSMSIGGEVQTIEYVVYQNDYGKSGARTLMLVLE